ncbi:basement membrane-specific heparan sulfate proteoglycan core protein-like isoform X2 [Corticium candelabrum]|uniref:basement membrane-specific heparan sulfate proteoglycan core protein-like isoform X2 n=1 Tax=Corticium candelabrum TaxID=121492 RepID=UPI002E25865D|nr:basement membrane-specific heparan sulfate proteoglycan core protein-like isoform X2 [Corticium candelabrum]
MSTLWPFSQFLILFGLMCSIQHSSANVPTFTVIPQSMTVLEGETIGLACAASGTPQPTLTWTFSSSFLQPQNDGTLIIRAVTKSDEGMYVCTASNINGRVAKTATVTVTLRYKPYFTTVPLNTTAANGSTVRLPCTAIGRPTPRVLWGKIDGQLPAGHSIEENYLILPNVNTTSSGVYECMSGNTHGSISAKAELTILAPIKFKKVPRNHHGLIGETALLECSIDPTGTPATISWAKDSILLDMTTTLRYHIIGGGSLLITDLRNDDMAQYTCRATGAVGEVTASAVILLPSARQPKFNKIPLSAQIKPKETAKLDCTAIGVPEPKVTWTKNGQSLAVVSNNHISLVGTQLVILSASPEDSGNFTCTATNIVGSISTSVTLMITHQVFTKATTPTMSVTTEVPNETKTEFSLVFIVSLAAGGGAVLVTVVIIIICCCCCCKKSDATAMQKVLQSKESFPSMPNGGAVHLGGISHLSFTNPNYEGGVKVYDADNDFLEQRLQKMGIPVSTSDKFQQALRPEWAKRPNHDVDDNDSEDNETDDDDSDEETETDDSENSEKEETNTGPDTTRHLKQHPRNPPTKSQHKKPYSHTDPTWHDNHNYRSDNRESFHRPSSHRSSNQRRHSHNDSKYGKTTTNHQSSRRGSKTEDRRWSAEDERPTTTNSQTEYHRHPQSRKHSNDDHHPLTRKSSNQGRRHSGQSNSYQSDEYERGAPKRQSQNARNDNNVREQHGRQRHSHTSTMDRHQRDQRDQMLF